MTDWPNAPIAVRETRRVHHQRSSSCQADDVEARHRLTDEGSDSASADAVTAERPPVPWPVGRSRREEFAAAYLRVRQDAARWVDLEQIAPVESITPRVLVSLLYRFAPLRATTWFRVAEAGQRSGVRGLSSFVQRRLLRRYALEMMPGPYVGGGLYIAHTVGCVLVAEHIGDNVTIVGQVTLGARKTRRWPTIGDGAYLGIGARIVGGVDVGAGAQVGANAVVLHDVAPGETVVGIPARPIRRSP
jgi:serine O-acetyltransferase